MNVYIIHYIFKGKYETIKIQALGFSHIADMLQRELGFVPNVIQLTQTSNYYVHGNPNVSAGRAR